MWKFGILITAARYTNLDWDALSHFGYDNHTTEVNNLLMSLNHALITLTIVPVLSHITYVNQSDVSFHESMHDWQHLTPPQSTLPWLQVRLHLRGFSVPFSVSLPTSPLTAHIAKTSISTYRIDAGLIWEGMCVVVCQVLCEI